MIRRFRLEQKSRFEKLVIAQRLSDMLDKFLSGRPAPLLIGAEQGDIGEWDDVVIHHKDGNREHLQIKRQSTPFCEKHIDKADYITSFTTRRRRGKGKGKDVEPASSAEEANGTLEAATTKYDSDFDSELDKAMKSLAVWSKTVQAEKPPKRAFTLTLVGLEVNIKGKSKDIIRASHLHEFCNLCKKDGLDLNALTERDDKPTQNVYKWLTSWCGFSDWHHVQQAMRLLTINCIGNEETLETRACESLGRHFIDAESTLSLLVEYISDSTTDVNVVSCHAAVRHLRAMLRPDVETWTQYQIANPSRLGWIVAGTHNLSGMSIEPQVNAASEVVNHHWGTTTQNRKLRLYANYTPTAALPSAILRLALHLKNGGHGMLLGESTWRQGAKNEIGYTFGIGDRDLDDLPWLENPEALDCAQMRKLSPPLETRDESAALHEAMNNLVWEQLQDHVARKLESITEQSLLSAMDSKWQIWATGLTADPQARELLFKQLMYPETEGLDATQALRIGPRTMELLESAIIMLLLVCVGIGNDDANWHFIPEIGDVLSIALRHWSGVAGDTKRARPLQDDALISVLGPSPASVVIFSGVNDSPTSLLEYGMADDFDASNSMAAERQPHLLVTRFRLSNILQTWTLTKLQNDYQGRVNSWRTAREAAINITGKGNQKC